MTIIVKCHGFTASHEHGTEDAVNTCLSTNLSVKLMSHE